MVHDACLGSVGAAVADCGGRRACCSGDPAHVLASAVASTAAALVEFSTGHGVDQSAHEAHAMAAHTAAASFAAHADFASGAPAYLGSCSCSHAPAKHFVLTPAPAAACAVHHAVSSAPSDFLMGPDPTAATTAVLNATQAVHVSPTAFLFGSDGASHVVSHMGHSAHHGHVVHADHLGHVFTEEELNQRKSQLAVAFGIAGSVLSLSVGAFATLVVRLAGKKVKERDIADGVDNVDSDESEPEYLEDSDDAGGQGRLSEIAARNMRVSAVVAAEPALIARKPEAASAQVPIASHRSHSML